LQTGTDPQSGAVPYHASWVFLGEHAETAARRRFDVERRGLQVRIATRTAHADDVVKLERDFVVIDAHWAPGDIKVRDLAPPPIFDLAPPPIFDLDPPPIFDLDPPRRRAINEPPTDPEVVALLQTFSQMSADDRYEVLRRLAQQAPVSFTRGDR
jgi:hypothetical protein